jgi:hypothetical protein
VRRGYFGFHYNHYNKNLRSFYELFIEIQSFIGYFCPIFCETAVLLFIRYSGQPKHDNQIAEIYIAERGAVTRNGQPQFTQIKAERLN